MENENKYPIYSIKINDGEKCACDECDISSITVIN